MCRSRGRSGWHFSVELRAAKHIGMLGRDHLLGEARWGPWQVALTVVP